MWWTRLKALIVKELLAVLRDPKGRVILIGPPIVQLLVFSYAATLEVRNVDVMHRSTATAATGDRNWSSASKARRPSAGS